MKTISQHLNYFLNGCTKLRDYVTFSERNLQEELQRYESSLGDENEPGPGDRFKYQRNLWSSLKHEFPQHHRKATAILFFSIFEDDLNEFCINIEHHEDLKVSLLDMSSKGIERVKLYLSKVVGLDFPSGENWRKIVDAKRVRDIFSHTSGYVKKERHGDIYRIVKSDNTLAIDANSHSRDRVVVRAPEYLTNFLYTVEGFYQELEREIKKKGLA